MNTSIDDQSVVSSSYDRKRSRKDTYPSDILSPQRLPRRRGCNCKKSGCLKLYCECFAANIRCGERCQCIGCKNRDHNRLEIAHAMETIIRRTHKSFKVEDARAPSSSSFDGATRLLLSAEKLDEIPFEKTRIRECTCTIGICLTDSPCHEQYGHCQPSCRCRITPPTQVLQEKARGCSCKKSNCLKLYCECLANQGFCDARCNCEGCKNRPDMKNDRQRAITTILERNPLAFQPKVATTGPSKHLRGCNCRKSNCMKNYCECHQAGVPCTNRCACQGCRNTETRDGQESLQTPQATSSSSTSLFPKPPRARRPFQDDISSLYDPSQSPAVTTTTPATHVPRTPPSQSTQQHSSLELLSRTAPSVLLPYKTGVLQSNGKRKLSSNDKDSYPRTVDHPSNHRRSMGGRTTEKRARGLFHTRHEHVVNPGLPPVEEILEAEYNATAESELPLARLGRSLLTVAMTAETEFQAHSMSHDSPERYMAQQNSPKVDSHRDIDGEDLLCEEDMDDNQMDSVDNDSVEKHEVDHRVELAAWQERTVLQEFSVWLRNLTTTNSLISHK